MTRRPQVEIKRPFGGYLDFYARKYTSTEYVFGLRNVLLPLKQGPGRSVSFQSLEDARRFVQYMIEAIKELEAMQNGNK